MKEKIITGLVIGVMSILISVNLVRGMTTTETAYTPEKVEVVYQAPKVEVAADEYLIEPETEVVEEQKPTYYELNLSNDEQDIIRKICADYGLEFELVLAICQTETNCNPKEIGDYGNSYGIMQIQPRWWQGYFDKNNCKDWLDIQDNVIVGCEILNYLYTAYEETVRVLNAYNSSDPDYYNGYSDRVLANYYGLEVRD